MNNKDNKNKLTILDIMVYLASSMVIIVPAIVMITGVLSTAGNFNSVQEFRSDLLHLIVLCVPAILIGIVSLLIWHWNRLGRIEEGIIE